MNNGIQASQIHVVTKPAEVFYLAGCPKWQVSQPSRVSQQTAFSFPYLDRTDGTAAVSGSRSKTQRTSSHIRNISEAHVHVQQLVPKTSVRNPPPGRVFAAKSRSWVHSSVCKSIQNPFPSPPPSLHAPCLLRLYLLWLKSRSRNFRLSFGLAWPPRSRKSRPRCRHRPRAPPKAPPKHRRLQGIRTL